MAKRNRSRIKKRRKRQLEKRFNAVAKVAAEELPPTLGEIYQKQLDEVYGGNVKHVQRFLNYKATSVHHCGTCRRNFFARPSLLIGSRPHVCGTRYEEKKTRSISKSKGKDLTWEEFYELVWTDHSYQEIARKLKINPDIVKDYFESEGLI